MLKVGLIGCGFMGAMHANCYKNIEGVELVAFADVMKDRAEAFAKGTNAKIYGDGYDLIASADVDIIDICLPTYLHAEYALKAMEKCKYVFVEKPVALTAEEGRALIAKSKETGAQVQVGQVVRFWDQWVELRKIVNSGVYGKAKHAKFSRVSPRPLWGWQGWLLDFERSGGAAQDLHVHDVDYVLSIFGEPKSFSTVKNVLGEKNVYISTVMQYDDLAVSLEATWDMPASYPFTPSFRVVFEKAAVEYSGDKFMLYTDEGASEIVIEKKELKGTVKGGNVSDLGGYYSELSYFCDCAATGAKIEQATLVDGVSSLEFLLKEIA